MIELFSIDYFMASYDQLVAITRIARKLSTQLKSLRTIVAGGSVPSRALLETAMAHVCKNIICRYGTTELGLVADAPATGVLDNPGLIGRVIPDIELAVFGPRGQRLAPARSVSSKAGSKVGSETYRKRTPTSIPGSRPATWDG